MTETDPLVFEFVVRCRPDHAFETWTARMGRWWPTDHSKSGDPDTTVLFEPRPDGRIIETTSEGLELEWGRVTKWEPPRRLAYRWYIGSEPHDATEVELTFEERNGSTAVTLVHRGWEIFGDDRTRRRADNRRGWGAVLTVYRRHVEATAEAATERPMPTGELGELP